MSQPSATRWSAVAALIAVGLLASFQIGKLPAAIPTMRADLALSLVAAAWVVSMLTTTTASLGVVAGVIGDTLGPRRLLQACLIGLAAGSALGAAATDANLLLAARFVEGVAFLGLVVSAPSLLIVATAGRDQGFILGLWSARTPLGMALMIVASPPLLAALGWRGVWVANAVLALVLLAWTLRPTAGLLPAAAPSRIKFWSDLRLALVRPGPWLLALAFTTYAAMWMAVMIWLPTYLIEAERWAPAAAAYFTAAVVVANVPANLVSGRLLARGLPASALIAFSSIVMGLQGYAMFEPAVPIGVKLALALGFSFLGGFLPGAIMVAAPRHAPSPTQFGAVNGIIVQGSNVGHLLGPPILALLVGAFGGWDKSGWFLLVAGFAGAGLALGVRFVEKRP
jgi:MFS family permease